MDWHIALAQPNCEKTAFAHLNRLRYRAYYPIIPKRRVLYGKLTIVHLPMFRPYVFVQLGANQDWSRLHTAPGVQVAHSLLSLEYGKYATVTQTEVDAIKETANALNAQLDAVKRGHGFQLGDQVKIKVGPFADFLATIDELDDEACRVGLQIYLLGRQIRIPRVRLDAVVAA